MGIVIAPPDEPECIILLYATENPPTINEDVSVASLGKRKAAQSEEGKKRRRGLGEDGLATLLKSIVPTSGSVEGLRS